MRTFGLRLTDLGSTPYHYAWERIFGGSLNPGDSARLLTLFPDPEFEDVFEFNAIHKAVLGIEPLDNAVQSDRSLIDKGDRFGRSPLSWAALRGDKEKIDFLLSNNAQVDSVNNLGSSPLFMVATFSGAADCVKALLKAGANASLQNQIGCTALHYAVEYAASTPTSLEIMALLLDSGIDVNIQNLRGVTPLHHCAEFADLDQLEFLIGRGADQAIVEHEGHNPLSIAMQKNRHPILKALLDHGGDHEGSLHNWGTFMHLMAHQADNETLRLFLDYRLKPRNINVKDSAGRTPLQVSYLRGNVDVEWRNLFNQFLRSIDKDLPPELAAAALTEANVHK